MSINIDKSKTAVVCMDFQNDIVHPDSPLSQAMGFSSMIEKHNILGNTRSVQDAARAAGMKVIHVNVEFDENSPAMPSRGMFFKMLGEGEPSLLKGTWGAEFHPDVGPKDGDEVVTKAMISGFFGSGLKELLDENGVTDIVVLGVATPFAVEGTVWSAVEMGFSCIVLSDATCAGSEEIHESTLNTSLMFLSDICTSEEFISAIK